MDQAREDRDVLGVEGRNHGVGSRAAQAGSHVDHVGQAESLVAREVQDQVGSRAVVRLWAESRDREGGGSRGHEVGSRDQQVENRDQVGESRGQAAESRAWAVDVASVSALHP